MQSQLLLKGTATDPRKASKNDRVITGNVLSVRMRIWKVAATALALIVSLAG